MSIPRFSVQNPVASNLLMLSILIAGAYCMVTITREFFPNSESEEVRISARYPGATPLEIEKSVTVKIEDAIQSIQGIDEISSTVSEGSTSTRVELHKGVDAVKVRRDIESEIAKIEDLPNELEKIDVLEDRPRTTVINIIAYGNVGEERLRLAIEKVKDDLCLSPNISEVDISGARAPEISISIHPDQLEKYGLTFAEVAQVIRGFNSDIPGGQLRTSRGNIRVRTLGESDKVEELEKIPVLTGIGGATVTLGDIATIQYGFEEVDRKGRYMGEPAIMCSVSKTPDQDALVISREVRKYIDEFNARGNQGYKLALGRDYADYIRARIDLMRRNAIFGLSLVFVALALFLDMRVAFWAAVGLPVSFMGTFLCMKLFGQTINIITLFGLIVVLGMLVDDAIIVGENIYHLREKEGLPPREAAIRGAEQMGLPVLTAVLTTMVAFLPLIWMEGVGSFTYAIPFVVISALGVSLLEAFAILPSHLADFMGKGRAARSREHPNSAIIRFLRKVDDVRCYLLDDLLTSGYEKLLRFCSSWRYVFLSAFIFSALYALSLPLGGHLKYMMFESTDSDHIYVNVEMPAGTPAEETENVLARIEQTAMQLEHFRSVFTVLGSMMMGRGSFSSADPSTIGQLTVELVPAEERNVLVDVIIQDLQKRIGVIPSAKSITMTGSRRGPSGDRIDVRVMSEDMNAINAAVERIKQELALFDGVQNIEDTLKMGKVEAIIRLRPSAANLGLSVGSLAGQLRSSFFGVKAQTLQRGTEELEVWARLDPESRKSLADIENLRIMTPAGGRVPFGEVAELQTARGFATLSRIDGRRTISVTATVDQQVGNTLAITEALIEKLQHLPEEIPGISLLYAGTYQDQQESSVALLIDFGVAVLLIYLLIAVLFHSYILPFVIMTAIPFSLVGATVGHYWTGWNLQLMSIVGMVALAGIVVNDSIVLVDCVSGFLNSGLSIRESVISAGKRRLRPIILTSVTTILGLAPIMMEKAVSARFLIPMAISISWGLLFSTVLTLFLLPSLYLIHEDIRSALRWCWTGHWRSIHEPRPELTQASES